jgi:glycosyltransferase involved in cell wall biosynthesis
MKRKLIFLVTEDWYFHMHRLPQARAARDAGYEVVVATRVREHAARIEAEGFRLVALDWKRGSLNPLAAALAVLAIIRIYRHEKPDIVHHVALKSVLLGTIAARIAGCRVILNAFTGLGQLFLGDTPTLRALRVVVFPMLRGALDSPRVHAIVENGDHRQILIDEGMLKPGQATVIRGSGIDVNHFTVAPEPEGTPVVACAARMLKSKGILVLAEAMRLLAARSVPLTLKLAGSRDDESADSLTRAELDGVAALPNVDYLGRISDMKGFWQGSHIGVLASITGEGLPVSLLEAASCGRPLVATDVAGCREIVVDKRNGFLVPPSDAAALAAALETLAKDATLRHNMGDASRVLVEAELSAAEVGRRTIALYAALLEKADA